MPNFFDRISFKYTLNPLDLDETRELIEFRVRQAGYRERVSLVLEDAIYEIYQYTKGYPRQITMLCHKALKEMVLRNKIMLDAGIVRELIQKEVEKGWHRRDLLLQKASY